LGHQGIADTVRVFASPDFTHAFEHALTQAADGVTESALVRSPEIRV